MSKPVIFFVHANGIPSACYPVFWEGLESEYSVDALPLLGVDEHYPVSNNWPYLIEQIADSIRAKHSAPVIGMGHSLGGLCLFMTAQKYPELFHSLVMIDPPVVMGRWASFLLWLAKKLNFVDAVTPAGKSKHRRDNWPSREVAAQLLRSKALFKDFHERAFDAYIQHGLCDTDNGVSLTIPVANEVAIFRTTPDNLNNYPILKPPALLITATKSGFAKTPYHSRLAKKHALQHVYYKGQHMFPLEEPEPAAAFILKYL